MTRRNFAAAGAALMLADSVSGQTPGRAVIELRYMKMRTNADNQLQRTSEFLGKEAVPALERAGAGPLGFFASVIGPDSPFVLAVAQFPSLAAMETIRAKQAADAKYQKALEAYVGGPLGYERLESSLIRCFESIPGIEVPPAKEQGPRVFEIRMYESNNTLSLAKKRKMFNEGEIAVFRKLGMRPVFFGETIVGAKMPNLVYMLAFDSLAHREQCWSAFGADPDWKALRSKPGYGDADLVSNITNSIVRPLPFSGIK